MTLAFDIYEHIIQKLHTTMVDARGQESHFESWLTQNEGICDAIDMLKELAKQEQRSVSEHTGEPVAVHQYRKPHCADWYDGFPDRHDGHGPYEIRTLYTTPQQRTWVGLTDEQIETCYETTGHYQTLRPQDRFAVFALARAIEAKLKEKNT
jgi:hypothetical protein